jgi:hypothetical protein
VYRIESFGNRFAHLHQSHRHWLQTGLFIPANDVTDYMLVHGVWLDDRERAFTHCLNSSSHLETTNAKNIGAL